MRADVALSREDRAQIIKRVSAAPKQQSLREENLVIFAVSVVIICGEISRQSVAERQKSNKARNL